MGPIDAWAGSRKGSVGLGVPVSLRLDRTASGRAAARRS